MVVTAVVMLAAVEAAATLVVVITIIKAGAAITIIIRLFRKDGLKGLRIIGRRQSGRAENP